MKKLVFNGTEDCCVNDNDNYRIYLNDSDGNEFEATYRFTDDDNKALELLKAVDPPEDDYTDMWRTLLCRKPDSIKEYISVIENENVGEHEDENNEYELYDEDKKTLLADVYKENYDFFEYARERFIDYVNDLIDDISERTTIYDFDTSDFYRLGELIELGYECDEYDQTFISKIMTSFKTINTELLDKYQSR